MGFAWFSHRPRQPSQTAGRTGEIAGSVAGVRLTAETCAPRRYSSRSKRSSGRSARKVAAQLFLSPRTVDFHLRNVFTKLGIASRTELATLQLDAHAPARPASAAEAPSR